jgi:prophage regulatory protein
VAEQIRNATALLRRKQVEALTGLARSTLYKLIGESKFPKPVQITDGGAVAWRSDAVDAWINSRVSAS